MQYESRALQETLPHEEELQEGRNGWGADSTEISERLPRFTNDLSKDPKKQETRFVKTILVPTDFSPASGKAVEVAVALAHQCGAAVTVLHVIDIIVQGAGGESLPAAEMMKSLWTKGSESMGRLGCSLDGQVRAQTVLEEGLPWEQIVERSHHVDLVVLGKGEPKSAWRLFSRRTAQRVIENAACPVVVVHS